MPVNSSGQQLPLALLLYGVRWRVLICAICDPENHDGGEDEELYEKPMVMMAAGCAKRRRAVTEAIKVKSLTVSLSGVK